MKTFWCLEISEFYHLFLAWELKRTGWKMFYSRYLRSSISERVTYLQMVLFISNSRTDLVLFKLVLFSKAIVKNARFGLPLVLSLLVSWPWVLTAWYMQVQEKYLTFILTDKQTEVCNVMQHWIFSLALYYFIHSLTLLQFSKLVKSLYNGHMWIQGLDPPTCALLWWTSFQYILLRIFYLQSIFLYRWLLRPCFSGTSPPFLVLPIAKNWVGASALDVLCFEKN